MKKIKLLLLVFFLVAANLIMAPQLFADVDWQLIGKYLAVPASILSLLIFARVLVTFGMPFWGGRDGCGSHLDRIDCGMAFC
jgi:hypothetical protein